MRALCLAFAASILLAGCGPPARDGLSESRSAAIEDSVASMLSALSEPVEDGNWERVAARYADDARFVFVEDGRVRYRSVDEVRAGFEEVAATFSGGRTAYEEPIITPLAPGLANVTSRFSTTLRRDEGPSVEFSGVTTMTVTHTGDGWKVLQGHTSTPRQRRGGGTGAR